MTATQLKRRGRPPKPAAWSHTVWTRGPNGRLIRETRPGPKPKQGPGRPTGPSAKASLAEICAQRVKSTESGPERVRSAVLRSVEAEQARIPTDLRALIRHLGTVERDEALCIAVATLMREQRCHLAAAARVVAAHPPAGIRNVGTKTIEAAYRKHRHRIEVSGADE